MWHYITKVLNHRIKSIPKMMTTTVPPLTQKTSVQMPQSLTANKLEENDANGDSIFDF